MLVAAAERRRPPLSRAEIDAVLHALDPLELRSPIVRRIAADAFATEEELGRFVARIRSQLDGGVTPSLLQLGCASGGVGLWLAEQLCATLVAVDPVAFAVESAMRACGSFVLDHFPTFACESYDDTRLASNSIHAAISLGALYQSPRPAPALVEIHRVLEVGGVLMFDAYVADDDPAAAGWVHALQQAGFDMLDIDDQTDPWRAVTREQLLARLHYEHYLVERLGARVAARTVAVARSTLSELDSTRRVELVARKRRSGGRRWPRGSEGVLPAVDVKTRLR